MASTHSERVRNGNIFQYIFSSDYLSDVGGVFKGYANAAKAAAHSPVSTAEFLGQWAGNDWLRRLGLKCNSGRLE